MSASRDKKTRQTPPSQVLNVKQKKQMKEELQAHRNRILYTVSGVVLAVLAAALLIWNSNFFQNRATAVSYNGEKFTAADVQYYYNSAMNQAYSNSYMMQAYGMSGGFDYNVSPKDQIYDEKTGQTWHDYFMDSAVDALKRDVALTNEAKTKEYTLSAAGQAQVDEGLKSVETSWLSSGYGNRAAFIRAQFGTTMTYDKFVQVLNRAALANDYAKSQYDSFAYTGERLNSYYKHNANEMDEFTITQLVFQATVEEKLDAQGNAVELTDAEKTASLEKSKAEMKAKAEAVQTALKAGEDPKALVEQYKPYLSNISETSLGTSVNTSYADWAYDIRHQGDVTLAEYDGDTVYNYYVARFEGRKLNQTPTASIRHILVAAEGADPTAEQYAAAKTKAEELLAQWKAGDATEDSFAALVADNTADAGSKTTGGLYEGISSSDSYAKDFLSWTIDPARKSGDTGIVQNTESSTKGYHLMYFVGEGKPKWEITADSALREEDYTAWQDALLATYTAERGSGMKYVG